MSHDICFTVNLDQPMRDLKATLSRRLIHNLAVSMKYIAKAGHDCDLPMMIEVRLRTGRYKATATISQFCAIDRETRNNPTPEELAEFNRILRSYHGKS